VLKYPVRQYIFEQTVRSIGFAEVVCRGLRGNIWSWEGVKEANN
jgi:hypothetical protein